MARPEKMGPELADMIIRAAKQLDKEEKTYE